MNQQSDVSDNQQAYKPTWESLDKHEVPEWYKDAKFGIFIHWGIYSVPAWAPKGEYSEWYPDYMQDPDNPVYQYHRETYGDNFKYESFIPMWKAENWDPEEWANLFEQAGAKYVVPVGEHHDGFPLWDSSITDWNAAHMGPKRDIIGELGVAVREQGMKYGPSYHALFNSYTPKYSAPHPDFFSDNYITFMNAKLKELIDKYKPDLMWLDGDWDHTPEAFKTKEMVAYYYNQAQTWNKEVVVNDRLGEVRGEKGDFYTQEYDYDTIDELIDHKWENTRGIANSFGYNQNEPIEDYQSVEELVETLVDNVSKNGNLLLDVGPKADGTITDTQKERLLGIGKWLDINGEAIYGTRSFVKPEDTSNGIDIRYTVKAENLYVIMLDWPEDDITFNLNPYVKVEKDAEVKMLGVDKGLNLQKSKDGITVKMPKEKPDIENAYTLKFKLDMDTNGLMTLFKECKKSGAFSSSDASHILNLHLTAINYYENKESEEKLIKHLHDFQELLEQQKNSDLISKDAYQDLNAYTDYLIQKQE